MQKSACSLAEPNVEVEAVIAERTMKMLNGSKLVAVLAIAAIARPALADFDFNNYDKGFQSSLSDAQTILGPAGAALSGQQNEGRGSITDQIGKIADLLKSNKKNNELRNKNLKTAAENDDLTYITQAIPTALGSIQKRNAEKDRAAAQAFASLPQAPFMAQAANVDTSKVDQACTQGVNFGPIQQLVHLMNSQPVSLARTQGAQIMEKAAQDKEDEFDKQLAKVFDDIEKAERKKENGGEFQQNIAKNPLFASLGSKSWDNSSLYRQLQNQSAYLEEVNKDKNKAFRAAMKDFMLKARKVGKNNKELAALQQQISSQVAMYFQATQQAVKKAGDEAFQRCLTKADQLGVNNPLAPNTKFNQAYQAIVALHQGNASFWANPVFMAMVAQISQQSGCSNPNDEINQQLSAIAPAVAGLNSQSITDPMTLVSGVLNVVNSMSTAFMGLQSAFDKTFNECQKFVDHSKALDGLVQNVNAKASQQQSGGGAPGMSNPRRNQPASHQLAGTQGRRF